MATRPALRSIGVKPSTHKALKRIAREKRTTLINIMDDAVEALTAVAKPQAEQPAHSNP